MDEAALITARKHASRHRYEVMGSAVCGCFHCLQTFGPRDIVDWRDEGSKAMCPQCGAPAVLGDASGFPVGDPAFLQEMHDRWFGRDDQQSGDDGMLEQLRAIRHDVDQLGAEILALRQAAASAAAATERMHSEMVAMRSRVDRIERHLALVEHD